MPERFYVTTPIYYVNAEPHIGHAYTTIVADVVNRFHKLLGDETYFLTGTDEHGDKIVQAAAEFGTDPKSYADRVSGLFRSTWPRLNISNDQFIRTTDPQHVKTVQYILTKVHESGDIYFSSYKGLYCVGCERFYTERELVDGKCPDHDKPPVEREEANYFFRMSKYQAWLIDHIEANHDFIQPERYRNEVLSFLREPLEDLCISRPKARLSWGIPLPFDDAYVTYVWFDALINYISALGYPDGDLFKQFWPSVQHVIAKDILKPHGIYWPTMLKAAGIPLYSQLNVHGYWNTGEGKMSKSRGTVVRPLDLVPVYGLDAFRYFVLREMVFGLDSSFSEDALVQRLNSDLANDLGNLFSRTLAMTAKYFDGKVPPVASEPDTQDLELRRAIEEATHTAIMELPRFGFHRALISIWEAINAANRYIDHVAPWTLAKDPALAGRLSTVIRTLLEFNRAVATVLSPFMPQTSENMLERLGMRKNALDIRMSNEGRWGSLTEGVAVSKGDALFPRIDPQSKGAPENRSDKKAQNIKEEESTTGIPIEAFRAVDLRVGTIKSAESVPKSKKLLKLIIDIGEDRQVVAGIALTHAPEDLVGKQVVVVANLQPAKLMSVESHGMVLAVRDGDNLRLLSPEKPVQAGSKVS